MERRRGPVPRPVHERFWEKVRKTGDDECWEWEAGRDAWGYGRFQLTPRENRLAHRIAYELAIGPVGRAHVLHRCDNPPCCNPAHLFLGDNAANVADRVSKGRTSRTTGIRHGRARLTPELAAMIRSDARSIAVLAADLGVAFGTVQAVRAGIRWREAE